MIDSSRHFLLHAVAISAVALSGCGRIWYEPLARDGSDGGRDAGPDAMVATRTFTCGWAISGYSCDNGRASVNVMSVDMGAAIIACRSMIPPAYPDFCYVRNAIVGGVPDVSDMMYCEDADPPPGTWRPASNCCNFMGTLSCP